MTSVGRWAIRGNDERVRVRPDTGMTLNEGGAGCAGMTKRDLTNKKPSGDGFLFVIKICYAAAVKTF